MQNNFLFAPGDDFIFEQFINNKLLEGHSVFIMTDENTRKYCFNKLIKRFPALTDARHICVASGENTKNISTCEYIWKELTQYHAVRKSLLINLGGGMICDLGGFAASVYKRGMDVCHVPTSLLAMIDAAIGGKTALDFLGFKNLLGTFCNVQKILINPDFLETLPRREIISGLAELYKIALVADNQLWNECESLTAEQIRFNNDLIKRAVLLKKLITDEDPYEHGKRKILNFGHTVGHAVEAFTLENYKVPLLHGEAVAIGMICETYISNKVNQLSDAVTTEIVNRIYELTGKKTLNASTSDLMRFMKNDKKNTAQGINFSLLKSPGAASFDNFIPYPVIEESLKYYKTLIR